MKKEQRILVTGGNGKTGRRIAAKLWDLGINIRIGSRQEKLPFDWYNENTWPAVLANVTGVYVCFQPDLAIPAAPAIIESFTQHCIRAGVSKLVLLSGRGEKEAEICENIVINSGIDYTILRASWFNQNFSENYLLDNVLAGVAAMPSGNVPEPFIDADDIADAAVAAFTDVRHADRLYEITGPELFTFKQAFAVIAEETGREIAFHDLSVEEYRSLLKEYKMPNDFIELIVYLYSEVMDGRNSSVTGDLEEVLGKNPKRFREFVRENFNTFSVSHALTNPSTESVDTKNRQ